MENVINTNLPIIEVTLGWLDLISLFSGVASLVMGGLAIWLSVTFFKMSDNASKEIKSSSDNINTNVEKLEKMFDTMYSDTFGMVKDSVSHMRQQVDRISSADNELSEEINVRIEEVIAKELNSVQTESMSKKEIKELFTELLNTSKQTEKNVKVDTIKEDILNHLRDEGEILYKDLRNLLFSKYSDENFNTNLFFQAIKKLTDEKLIVNRFRKNKEGKMAISTSASIKLR